MVNWSRRARTHSVRVCVCAQTRKSRTKNTHTRCRRIHFKEFYFLLFFPWPCCEWINSTSTKTASIIRFFFFCFAYSRVEHYGCKPLSDGRKGKNPPAKLVFDDDFCEGIDGEKTSEMNKWIFYLPSYWRLLFLPSCQWRSSRLISRFFHSLSLSLSVPVSASRNVFALLLPFCLRFRLQKNIFPLNRSNPVRFLSSWRFEADQNLIREPRPFDWLVGDA